MGVTHALQVIQEAVNGHIGNRKKAVKDDPKLLE